MIQPWIFNSLYLILRRAKQSSCSVLRQYCRMRTRWDNRKIVITGQMFILKGRFPRRYRRHCENSVIIKNSEERLLLNWPYDHSRSRFQTHLISKDGMPGMNLTAWVAEADLPSSDRIVTLKMYVTFSRNSEILKLTLRFLESVRLTKLDELQRPPESDLLGLVSNLHCHWKVNEWPSRSSGSKESAAFKVSHSVEFVSISRRLPPLMTATRPDHSTRMYVSKEYLDVDTVLGSTYVTLREIR